MSEQDLEVYRRSRLPPSAFRLPGMEDAKVQRQQVRSTLDIGRLKLQQPSCSKDADGVQLRNSSPENGKLKNEATQVCHSIDLLVKIISNNNIIITGQIP